MRPILSRSPGSPAGSGRAPLCAVAAGAIVLSLFGCNRAPSSDPSIAAIRVNPNPVPVESNAAVTLSLRYPCDGMAFHWSASAGSFNPPFTREPATIFVPPAEGTPARITAAIEVNGKVVCSEETLVRVVGLSAAPSNAVPTTLTPAAKPRVHITTIPVSNDLGGPMSFGRIAGRVDGITVANAGDYRVIIYAKTDDWWVQPTAAQPYTVLDEAGRFDEEIHLGSEYAVLLVTASFTTALPRIPVLPRRGSDGVLEVLRIKGRTGP